MAKIIDVTVKTLDSLNHLFQVSEELTVKEFKEQILPQVGIPVEQQRLIFRGRVLQDDKKISEYNVASNTVHLVQRPVQPPGSARNDEPQRQTNQQQDGINFDGGTGGGIIIHAGAGPSDRNAIIMGTIASGDAGGGNQGTTRRNSAAVRLQVGNEMLHRASNLLQRLEEEDGIAALTSASNDVSPSSARDSDSASLSPMDVELDDQDSFGRMISQVANAASAAALVAAIRQVQPNNSGNGGGASGGPPNQSSNATSAAQSSSNNANASTTPNSSNSNTESSPARNATRRPDAPRLREMETAVQDILAFQERFTPFLQHTQNILRENRAYDNTSELQSVQYVFDTVSSILHVLGHAYHAYSDLMCDFASPPETRRVRASSSILVEQSTVVRATIPLAVPMGGFNMPANFGVQGQQIPHAPPPTAAQPSAGAASAVPEQPQAPIHGHTTHHHEFHGHPMGQGNVQTGIPGVSINIQANAGIPDLASLLGPAMGVGVPAGLMPFLNGLQANMQRGGAINVTTTGAMPNQTTSSSQQSQQQGQVPAQDGGGGGTPIFSVGGGPQPTPPTSTTTQQTQQPQANNNANNLNNIFSNLQRNDLMRPPFDMLLSCHSHHNSRSRQRSRPNDLHRFVNVRGGEGDASTSSTIQEIPQDFFQSLIDYFRCSAVVATLQPLVVDWIQGYLMRGRDVKNVDHIRTCSRSMGKKILPFFQSFTDKIAQKNEDVVYQDTFSNLITNFYTSLIQHVLQSGPTIECRNGVLSIVEEFLMSLFSVFAACFPDNPRIPEIFANAIVDEYFGGMSLVFRSYARLSLLQYFSALSRAESANEPLTDSPIVYRRVESEQFQDAVNDSDGSFKSASGSDCTAPIETPATAFVPPAVNTKIESQVASKNLAPPIADTRDVESMDDDDDILDIRPPPVTTSTGGSNIDPALRHLPAEWLDTVRLDIRRQLGMPEQPPLSAGFCTLFPRKH